MENRKDHYFPPATYRCTATGIVCRGRCIVWDAGISAGVDAATLTIYDGVDTNGNIKKKLAAAATSSDSWFPTRGCLFEQGVYIALSGTSPDATLNIEPLNESAKAPIDLGG